MKVVTLKDIPNVPVDGAAEPIEGVDRACSTVAPDHPSARRVREL